MARFLITGSQGFIGGNFLRAAVSAGHTVLGLGHASRNVVAPGGEFIQVDLIESDVSGIIRDFAPDVLFHAAGSASVIDSIESPLVDLRKSILTWATTLEGIRQSGVRPLILFPSSAAVYGNPRELPIREDARDGPISPYGYHKAACELLAKEYCICFGLDITVCRLFSVFGPAQKRLLIWELFEQAAGSASEMLLKGTGDESRDYIHVEDLTEALLRIVAKRLEGGIPRSFEVINVASGSETPVFEVAKQIRDIVAPGKAISAAGRERAGDPSRWCADISVLRSLAPSWNARPFSVTIADCIDEWRNETIAGRTESASSSASNRHS